MALSRIVTGAVVILAVIAIEVFPFAEAQALALAPAPASDGTSIDQGIAYLLMLLALVLTYLVHTMDGSFSYY